MAHGFDGSHLLEAPLETWVAALPEHLSFASDLRAILIYRALERLRSGTRAEMREEAIAVETFLASEAAAALSKEEAGAWSAIAQVLIEAARRSDPEAVEMILRGHPLYGQRVLELLAANGDRPLPRTQLIEKLRISQSQLSHLLRDLEEADLIARTREGGREVMVSLGPVGREHVERNLFPNWVNVAAGHIAAALEGTELRARPEIEAVIRTAGAPALIAQQLALALSPSNASERSRFFIEGTLSNDRHAGRFYKHGRGETAVAGFGGSKRA